jgi:hypothetical protein
MLRCLLIYKSKITQPLHMKFDIGCVIFDLKISNPTLTIIISLVELKPTEFFKNTLSKKNSKKYKLMKKI